LVVGNLTLIVFCRRCCW